MAENTKKVVERVNSHREDGEEALKRASTVAPINAGEGSESAEGNANTPSSGKDIGQQSPRPDWKRKK